MLQELKVAIRIQTFENRNSVPIYPKNFHSNLHTVKSASASSAGSVSYDSPVSMTPKSSRGGSIGIATPRSSRSFTGGNGITPRSTSYSNVFESAAMSQTSLSSAVATTAATTSGGSKSRILSRHGSLRELILNQNSNSRLSTPRSGSNVTSPRSSLTSPRSAISSPGGSNATSPRDGSSNLIGYMASCGKLVLSPRSAEQHSTPSSAPGMQQTQTSSNSHHSSSNNYSNEQMRNLVSVTSTPIVK